MIILILVLVIVVVILLDAFAADWCRCGGGFALPPARDRISNDHQCVTRLIFAKFSSLARAERERPSAIIVRTPTHGRQV